MPQTIRDWVVRLWHYYMMARSPPNMVANAETQAPVKTEQTLYRVASVSKTVTAWGVMKLVEEGKLSLGERETGKVTFEARRQSVYRLIGPASVAIVVGAVVIMCGN